MRPSKFAKRFFPAKNFQKKPLTKFYFSKTVAELQKTVGVSTRNLETIISPGGPKNNLEKRFSLTKKLETENCMIQNVFFEIF